MTNQPNPEDAAAILLKAAQQNTFGENRTVQERMDQHLSSVIESALAEKRQQQTDEIEKKRELLYAALAVLDEKQRDQRTLGNMEWQVLRMTFQAIGIDLAYSWDDHQ